MQTIAIRIGIFVLIGIGALIARPFMTGAAGDLKVGECFDVSPTATTIEDVQHHPCTTAHVGEVFFVGVLPGATGAKYPTDEALQAAVGTLCGPAFAAYTGLSLATDPVWTYGYGVPLSKDWTEGKRRVMCYATRMDDKPTSASIKKS
jgi:Septum formation